MIGQLSAFHGKVAADMPTFPASDQLGVEGLIFHYETRFYSSREQGLNPPGTILKYA
jgi:hypothetical protein